MKLSIAALGWIVLLALAACGPTLIPPPPPHDAPATELPPTLALDETRIPETPTPNPTASETPTLVSTPNLSALPSFGHIYVVVMENKEYGSVVGSASTPYLNGLIAQYGLATNYRAVSHPSEPNYLALFSGSTQGVEDDGVYNLSGENLADQIEAAGKTWRVFAENVPTDCFKGQVATNGGDGLGTYARKHNPAISFTDISSSPARCANITDWTHFDPAAANYELIVPNLCHDMHDCSVSVGDRFLRGFVPGILNSSAWQDGGALFIVWDEGSTNLGRGGRVPLLVISKQVAKGFRSAAAFNHYSLLRTIEDAWGLACLNLACEATNLGEFFR